MVGAEGRERVRGRVCRSFPRPCWKGSIGRSSTNSAERRKSGAITSSPTAIWICGSVAAGKTPSGLGLTSPHPSTSSISVWVLAIFCTCASSLGTGVSVSIAPGFIPFGSLFAGCLASSSVVEHTIKPKELLPPNLGSFDLVTSFRAQFNYHGKEKRLWDLDEWNFFLDDLRDNVLKPDGRFALRLAKQDHKRQHGGYKRSDEKLLSFMVERESN